MVESKSEMTDNWVEWLRKRLGKDPSTNWFYIRQALEGHTEQVLRERPEGYKYGLEGD